MKITNLIAVILILFTVSISAENSLDGWEGRKGLPAVVNPIVRSRLQEVISLRGKWEFVADPKAVGRDA
ncbi:MAG: hypothetical protein PHR77_17035, partial [Kiritimatiellae bacterium]|nr:hypothetical protein [Kiritimatiellia bacterium]